MGNGHHDSVDIRIKTEREAKVFSLKKFVATARCLDLEAGKPIIVINEVDAKEHNIIPGQRVELIYGKKKKVAIVDTSESLVKQGEVGLFDELSVELKVCTGKRVEIKHLPIPESLKGIMKKISGGKLNKREITYFIDDVMENRISEAEVSAFLVASEIRGLDLDETVSLTEAMVSSGEMLNLRVSPVVDKHSIGGVAGNRTTMVIVPILAAAGCYVPKTSSRAITSPAGTADTMEVLAPVEFSIEELERLVLKTHGAIVWGGGVNIAPADDKMIRIRRPLHLDPEGVMLASILAKKKAVSSKYLLIDIPVGRGAKVEDVNLGKKLGSKFKEVASELGIKTSVIITDGSEPIGNGIGPALECRDVLSVLEGNGPADLRHKGLLMAGALLEMAKVAKKGEGYKLAESILKSKKALKKMKEIIKAQGGNEKVTSKTIPVGEFTEDIVAERPGRIEHIDNRNISMIARAAGAPMDKGAGVYLYRVKGDVVKKGEKILTVYAESEEKLSFALRVAKEMQPITMEKMLLEEI